ncbi:MAG: chorismate-binding protein, partial [Candidatus Omnitrophica bacterium]|nr:chorismate-binding protein [Candidatus Omnitrophota bacterium]
MGYFIWKSYNFYQDTWRIFEAIKEKRNCFFLDSAVIKDGLGRYSFLGLEPFYILKTKNRIPFNELRQILNEYKIKRPKDTPPFIGGGVGFFAYDFGLLLEKKLRPLYRADTEIPDCYFAFYNSVIAIDHYRNKLFLFSQDKSTFKKLIRMLAEIDFRKREVVPETEETTSPTSNFKKRDYLEAVKKAKAYIAQGDIYQVNLSQKFTTKSNFSAAALYQRLRKISPACFSAYLDGGDFQIIYS